MDELLPTLVALVLAGAVLAWVARLGTPRERQLVGLGALAHLASAFAQVLITRYFYGYGDMLTYHFRGGQLAQLLRYDFVEFAPKMVQMWFHGTPDLPIYIHGVGTATGSMMSLATWLNFFFGGSIYAASIAVTTASFVGKVALYRAFRERLDASLHTRAIVAAMLIPSAVYWTSGIVKEAVLMAGLGPLVLGAFRLERRPVDLRAWALVVVGGGVAALVKPYVLFTVVVALAAFVYWERAGARAGGTVQIRPIYLVFAGGLAIGGVIALGRVFPEYSLDRFAESSAELQRLGAGQVSAGSNYQIVEGAERGVLAQFAFAPLALLTSLYRPFVFEANNAVVAVNSLETTAVLVLSARLLVRHRLRHVRDVLLRSPMLVFCATFTVIFGVAVGLASTNLGTLSRYRAPMLPFFVGMLLFFPYLLRASRAPRATPDTPRAP